MSPIIEALTTVREENAVRRSGLRALQQITDPVTASKAQLDYVPVLNPGEWPSSIPEGPYNPFLNGVHINRGRQ